MIAELLNLVLGPRCQDCQLRVFPKDLAAHRAGHCPSELAS